MWDGPRLVNPVLGNSMPEIPGTLLSRLTPAKPLIWKFELTWMATFASALVRNVVTRADSATDDVKTRVEAGECKLSLANKDAERLAQPAVPPRPKVNQVVTS